MSRKHKRRNIYHGAGVVRGGIVAEHGGPAGYLDPEGRGMDASRCASCEGWFVIYPDDAERTHCYRCVPKTGGKEP